MNYRTEPGSDANHEEPQSSALAWSKGIGPETLRNLAHELRTPLQALLGYVDILREDILADARPEVREIFDRMAANAYDLGQAIDNLLAHTLAKAGAPLGKTAEDFSLRALMADITPLLEAANAKKALRLRFDVRLMPEAVYAPRQAWRTILLNLALNAIKFTEMGSVSLILRPATTARGDGYEIEITDSGPGLSQEGFNLALKPFAQLSAGNNRRHRGLGLGLPVACHYVHALGGRIQLSAPAGGGTRITISLPPIPRAEAKLQIERGRHGQMNVPPPGTMHPSKRIDQRR